MRTATIVEGAKSLLNSRVVLKLVSLQISIVWGFPSDVLIAKTFP